MWDIFLFSSTSETVIIDFKIVHPCNNVAICPTMLLPLQYKSRWMTVYEDWCHDWMFNRIEVHNAVIVVPNPFSLLGRELPTMEWASLRAALVISDIMKMQLAIRCRQERITRKKLAWVEQKLSWSTVSTRQNATRCCGRVGNIMIKP